MRRISRTRLVLAVLAAVAAALGAQAVTGRASSGGESDFAGARAATAKYHLLATAKANDYGLFRDAAGIACIDNQPTGGMGVHYVKGALVGDDILDSAHPEALVYAPNAAGQLRLAALEYIVFKDVWDAHHTGRPSLFGQEFNLTPAPNRFGIPSFYSLHAWVWEPNSSGLLQPWNPKVHC
jgi:hypothetical protein